ncbi:hypothetical protein R5N98_02760 [Tenacibaculum maritimum]|uniref:hypothetical protein n=1 Tax=Tenacibaculum maritimum TaxID=107401 RepID=UPI00132F5B79|nr:hypothetical protein [Tenacibaculum maritimum]
MKDLKIKGKTFKDVNNHLKKINIVNSGDNILLTTTVDGLIMQVVVSKCTAKKINKHLKKLIKIQ